MLDRPWRPSSGGRSEGLEALRQLGLGMLFLLAGYEIELKELTGHGGRRALQHRSRYASSCCC